MATKQQDQKPAGFFGLTDRQLRNRAHSVYCMDHAFCDCPTIGDCIAEAKASLHEARFNWKPAPWGSTQREDIAYSEKLLADFLEEAKK